MKRIAIAVIALALAGCQAVKNVADTAINPPLDVMEHLKALFVWLGSLFGPVFWTDLFNSIFG